MGIPPTPILLLFFFVLSSGIEIKYKYLALPLVNEYYQKSIDNIFMNYIDELTKYTKKRRLEAKYSLNKFCFDAEIEPASLSRYENGQRKISLEALIKIAKVYNQSLSEFLKDFENSIK